MRLEKEEKKERGLKDLDFVRDYLNYATLKHCFLTGLEKVPYVKLFVLNICYLTVFSRCVNRSLAHSFPLFSREERDETARARKASWISDLGDNAGGALFSASAVVSSSSFLARQCHLLYPLYIQHNAKEGPTEKPTKGKGRQRMAEWLKTGRLYSSSGNSDVIREMKR